MNTAIEMNLSDALRALRELRLYNGETHPRHPSTHRRYWVVTECKGVQTTAEGTICLIGPRFLLSPSEVCAYAAARMRGEMPGMDEWRAEQQSNRSV